MGTYFQLVLDPGLSQILAHAQRDRVRESRRSAPEIEDAIRHAELGLRAGRQMKVLESDGRREAHAPVAGDQEDGVILEPVLDHHASLAVCKQREDLLAIVVRSRDLRRRAPRLSAVLRAHDLDEVSSEPRVVARPDHEREPPLGEGGVEMRNGLAGKNGR